MAENTEWSVEKWAADRLHKADGSWADDAIHCILYAMENHEPGPQGHLKKDRNGGWGLFEDIAKRNKEEYFKLNDLACQFLRDNKNHPDTKFFLERTKETIRGLTDEESIARLQGVVREFSAH